jgi:hypothetical protein
MDACICLVVPAAAAAAALVVSPLSKEQLARPSSRPTLQRSCHITNEPEYKKVKKQNEPIPYFSTNATNASLSNDTSSLRSK